MLVGYVPSAEGTAALRRAIAEASRSGERLIVINSALHPTDAEGPIGTEVVQSVLDRELAAAGVEHTIQQLAVGDDAAEAIVDTARAENASLIVIGIRHRSPVGKLILGSTAQRVLLDAECPVLAVKG